MDKERWLPVVGHEATHVISDRGNARSLDKTIVVSRPNSKEPFVRRYHGRLLSHASGGGGGHHVVILSCQGRPVRRALVHHLVLEAFVGPRPPGTFGLHRDDDPHNNVLSNLYWGTKGDNADDKVRNGNHHFANRKRCPRDHPYDDENTMWEQRANGRRARHCRQCGRDRKKR